MMTAPSAGALIRQDIAAALARLNLYSADAETLLSECGLRGAFQTAHAQTRTHELLADLYGALADTYPPDAPGAEGATTEMTNHLTLAGQYEQVRETLREGLTADTCEADQ